MQVEAESKPTPKLCQSLTCGFDLCLAHDIYSLSHCIYTQKRGGAQGTDREEDAEKHSPGFPDKYPTQTGIHPCHSRLLWRRSTFCVLAVPASTWEEHTSPPTGQEVRGQKLREVEPSEGRRKFTKWIERKSGRCGKEKERE